MYITRFTILTILISIQFPGAEHNPIRCNHHFSRLHNSSLQLFSSERAAIFKSGKGTPLYKNEESKVRPVSDPYRGFT